MRDETPVLSPVFVYIDNKEAILFLSPWALYHLWVENLLPTMKTLDIGAVFKLLGDALPILGSHLLYKLFQLSILNNRLISKHSIHILFGKSGHNLSRQIATDLN